MICPSCTHENRPTAKFCRECGTPLHRRCASCGAELPAGTKFCDECGAQVPGAGSGVQLAGTAVDAGGTRKVVSILFADLAGSTALHERLDPESARRFMESYYALARVAVEGNGGAVAKLLGDGVMAVFGIPRVAEDDAVRAVRAGVAMQVAFRALATQQRGAVGDTGLRVAVNTGEVVVKGDEILGDPVNVAARLQERGRDGDVVIGEATRRLVAAAVSLDPLGSLDLKGRAEAVKAYRVVSLDAPRPAAATTFVGREDELARIAAVHARAIDVPATHLAVLLGSPGLGKSRLIAEFARRCGDTTTVVAAQCDAAGGATFAPIAEALRELLVFESRTDRSDPTDRAQERRRAVASLLPESDADRDRVAVGIAALLAGSPGAPEETFFVVRRFLAGLARSRPVVLVIDDLQWAEPLLLDLVEHLVQWGRGLPLLVLVGARPELREVRSSFATPGGFVADVVALGALDAGVAMRLAAGVIGAADLPAAVAAKVLAASEGNPLFIGELVRMLVDEGALIRDGNRWTTGETLATVEMPPTIHALLAARIERLEPQQCAVLERAAVVGRQFSRSAVAALWPGDGSGLDAQLEALQRAQLIERDTGWLLGEPALRFHHVLIRDAAYRRLLKGTRAELHERLASWIEARVGAAPEHDETIGRHLEEAYRLLSELGPVDAAGQQRGERAASRLAAAGRRALEGDDVQLAAGLLGRALGCLPPTAEARAELALDWCEALLSAGDVEAAARAIAELRRCADSAPTDPSDPSDRTDRSQRLRAWHTCFSGHLTVMTAPQELQATAAAVAAAAEEFSRFGDAAGEGKARFVHALALARLGKVGACEAALDQALAAARRADDRRRANTVLAIAPLAALWGPSPVTRASGRCLDVVRVLRITQGAPAVEAVALSCQGVLEALRGRTEAAHRMIASGREMLEELGIAQRLFETDVFAGFVAMLEGDVSAAERILRGAYDGLRELGLGIDAARAAALLARALLVQGRGEEVEVLSRESEALAGDDLKAAIAWRGVRAEALARRGQHAEAIDFARAAVAIAASTDALLDHADARLALAASLRAAGRSVEAGAEERRAVELWEAKGATRLAEGARGRPAEAVQTNRPPLPRGDDRGGDRRHEPPPGPLLRKEGGRRRPVRPNFAIEEARRAEAAVAARDVDALESLYRRDVEIVDHQFGVEYGHDAIVERVRLTIQESTDGTFRHEDLATLGDFVALCRLHSTASGSFVHDVPFATTAATYLLVIEADKQGCARRIDIFGEHALGGAIARLYARYAELSPEGAARVRAAATSGTIAALLGPADFDAWCGCLASDVEFEDHRTLGFGSLRGREAVLPYLESLFATSETLSSRIDKVLALEPGAFLVHWTEAGVGAGGGDFERVQLALWVLDAEGFVARVEYFDLDREAEALVRFEELVPSPVDEVGAGDAVPRRVRPNAASRSMQAIEAGFVARDRDAIVACLGDPLHTVEHPTGASYGREGQLASIDRMLALPCLEFRMEVLASLGESLGLGRRRVRASGTSGGRFDVAEYEMDHIVLSEVDDRQRLRRSEVFAADHLGDALVRLYELYAEQQPDDAAREQVAGIARSLSAFNGPIDLGRIAPLYHPASRNLDHRVFGTWTTEDAAELLDHFRHQLELAPDFAARFDDVLALSPDALLVAESFFGTVRESGGPFENRLLVLFAFGADGRITETETFEAEHRDAALACFDALAGPVAPFERDTIPDVNVPHSRGWNRADAFRDSIVNAWHARDWPAMERLLHDDFRFSDRRPLFLLDLDRDGWIDMTRQLADMDAAHLTAETVATRGERLVLFRVRIEVADGDVGPSLVESLNLWEADEQGERLRSCARFEATDVAGAYAELDRLYGEGEGCHDATWQQARRLAAALPRGDVDACRAALAPAFRVRDHRKLSWGDTLRDADTFLRAQRALSELSPDWRYRIDHHRARGRVQIGQQAQVGTREGGAFENPFVVVTAYDETDRVLGFDIYDVDQLDQARVRFEELAGTQGSSFADPARTSPLHIPPNAATRGIDRWVEGLLAGDADAVAALMLPSYTLDDRRPLFLTVTDRDAEIAGHLPLIHGGGWQVVRTVLATAGDRLALQRCVWTKVEGGVRSEIEVIEIDELGESGRFVRSIVFAPENHAAAHDELFERYVAMGADGLPQCTIEWLRAVNAHDLVRARDAMADDFVLGDYRRAGMGRVVGADAYIDALAALYELIPDARMDALFVVTAERHGRVTVNRTWGHNAEGGEVESLLVALVHQAGEKLSHIELFEVEHLDYALVRLAEIGSGRTNAATRARERQVAAFVARDWDAVRRLATADFVYEDRGKRALVAGDVEAWVASMQYSAQPGFRPSATLIGTFGDRVALDRVVWSGEPGGDAFEFERVRVLEADAEGHMRAVIMFDPEDRLPAANEAMRRFAAAERVEPVRGLVAWGEAQRTKRWGDLRSICTPDFAAVDHRPLGVLGTLDREQWLESLKAIDGLGDGVTYAAYDVLAWDDSAIVVAVARTGTVADGGGEIDDGFLSVMRVDDGHLQRVEVFAEDDTAGALECFAGQHATRR